ncbi:MAG: ABC transporter permease, partial [Spirochaetes bacterium]
MKISASGNMLKRFRHEFIILAIIVVLSITIGSINSQFYSVGNIYSLLKSTVIMGLFALGSFLVLVSGDIDISFTAIGVFCMYVTSKLVLLVMPGAGIVLIMLIAGLMGVLLGFINAVFISLLKMPGLIVTLGTGSMIRGFLLTFIGVRIINKLPDSMIAFSKITLLHKAQENGHIVGLSIGFVVFIAFAILIY